MNERIERLAEQCWVHTKEPLFGAKSPHWEFDRHKFAELIVRECADLLKKEAESSHDEETETYNLLLKESKWMKKHFGVEE